MITYVNENLNPKGKKTGDCVIRAIAKASRKDYKEVYKDLFELSLKTGYVFNDKRNYEKLIEVYGFIKYKQPRKIDNTKYLVRNIDSLVNKGTILVLMANHLTCVIDNVCYDIWDCRNKCISNYYVLK